VKHLLDIDVLSSSGPPHEWYAEVRAREPVSWQEMPGVGGYGAVMRHANVLAVSRDPERFSARTKGMQLADFTDQLPTLRSLDPPRHTQIRKRVLYSFAPRVVRGMEERMRALLRATRDSLIRAGDRVVMMYASANRDEAVFHEPQRFDVTRDPNPHVSFGFGEHFCLGAALGRLEARVFFEEFFARFARLEPTGEPARMRSNELNAWKRIPVRLTPR
jgi:cytochrome P450